MKIKAPPYDISTRAPRATTPWFLKVQLQARPEGWAAFIRLDPTTAKVRAAQQGLADSSLRAAVEDIQVRQMWGSYIARARDVLPADAQIVAYTPVFDIQAGGR
jgi:hypothetical protein